MAERMTSCVASRCVLCTLPLDDEDAQYDDDHDDIFVASLAFPEFEPSKFCVCMVNCQHTKGLAYGCHMICAQAGLPSFANCRVVAWDNAFTLSKARSSEYECHLMHNGNTKLDIARSVIQRQLSITEACQAEVDTSSCIWATYVTLRGEKFLSDLSNEAGDELVYDPTTFSTSDVIYIAQGPLGIQNIVFAYSMDELELETVSWNWWQDVPFAKGETIRFDFDGLKIRTLYANHENNSRQPMWSQPSLRPSLIHSRMVQHSEPARFNRITVNDPETSGYSIPWNAAYRALTIVPHTPSSDLRCYSEYSEGTTWLHIPLRSGELLKEIWRRTCYSRLSEEVDLVIVTSDSNIHILGPHESSNRQYSYLRLATLRDSRNYLYIDDSVGSIRELALDPDPSVGNDTWDDYRPQPLSPNPGEGPNWNISERFFYTSAWLTDLISINICQFNEVVTGLLLHYEDGSVGSLGQVRLDRLQGERQVPNNATIRFTVLRTVRQCPYVSGVLVLTEQSARPPLNYGLDLEVKCQGIMEWWFTRRQCLLAYKNRTSGSTCL